MKRFYSLLLVLALISSALMVFAPEATAGWPTIHVGSGLKVDVLQVKDGKVQYTTRPMRQGEYPQTYTIEIVAFGRYEGIVVVKEHE
jgi:hypothetical protein